MCDKIVTLSKDDIRTLINDALSKGVDSASELSARIKKDECLDGKCDFKATGYILSILKTMIEENAIISENQKLKVNESYVFVAPAIDMHIEMANKFNISGDRITYLSRTDRFFPAWSSLYIGQKIEILLLPEPNNPNDSNAIAATFKGKHIGYLQREVAKEYHDRIISLTSEGFNVIVNAEVVSSKNMGTKNCAVNI